MRRVVGVIALLPLIVAEGAAAYDADLIPVRNRPEAHELVGKVSITGEDGTVRVHVTDVLDPAGELLEDKFLRLDLRLRVNGRRRRSVVEVPVSGGAGAVQLSLGLAAGDRVVVASVRLRGPTKKLLAEAGVVTMAPLAGPAPSADECPSALESCQGDLQLCIEDLDACEEAF